MQLYAPAGYPLERLLPHLAADRMSCQLASARDRVSAALARAAASFVRMQGWIPFGYVHLGDFSLEVLERSGRWLRDLAVLGDGLRRSPGLELALLGRDGKRPIGRVAATCIARVAAGDDLDAWIVRARGSTVRELRLAVRATRAFGAGLPAPNAATAESVLPGGESAQGGARRTIADEGEDSEACDIRMSLPRPVAVAFDEVLDLHRAVSGYHASVGCFVEALAAETMCGLLPPGAGGPADSEAGSESGAIDRPRVGRSHADVRYSPGDSTRLREERLASETNHWSHLASLRRPEPEESLDRAAGAARHWEAMHRVLSRVRSLAVEAGEGDAEQLARQLRDLVRLEDDIDRCLGRLLHEMDDRKDWEHLRFTSLGHYAEERLGISRRSAERRAGLVRNLRRLPRVLAAYESGELGLQAALLVRQALEGGHVTPELERAWILRAHRIAVKRLQDEVRGMRRRLARGDEARGPVRSRDPRWPVEDAEWYASLRRDPGTARARVQRLGRMALDRSCANVFLRLRLEDDVGVAFLDALEGARRHVAARAACWLEGEAGRTVAAEGSLQLPISFVAACSFVRRSRAVPSWVGLLSMLEDFVETWDDPRGFPKREWDETYCRAGWRCEAPGCTARCRIEDHHILYRSRNGCDEPWNQLCLCRRHHKLGEHGGLARCRGTAPLGVTWRLGRPELGTWFRNERRLSGPDDPGFDEGTDRQV